MTKVSYSIERSMFWLIDSLQNLQEKFKRLLIYCTTIKDAAKVYNYVLEELPSCGQFIELYHSQTEDPKKEYIVNELQNSESSLILVSTSALGMGIDAKGFNSVWCLVHKIVDPSWCRKLVELEETINHQ